MALESPTDLQIKAAVAEVLPLWDFFPTLATLATAQNLNKATTISFDLFASPALSLQPPFKEERNTAIASLQLFRWLS